MCFPDVIIALASILSDSKKLDSVNTLRYTLEIQISELWVRRVVLFGSMIQLWRPAGQNACYFPIVISCEGHQQTREIVTQNMSQITQS